MSDSYGEQARKILMITGGILLLGAFLFLTMLRLYALHCRRHEAERFFGDTNPAEMGDRGAYLRRLFVGMFVNVPRDVPGLHRAGPGTPFPEEEKLAFGLAASVVESLPTFTFKRGSERLVSRENLECPVCLNEFAEDERGRILPQCGHCFHAECVDMWFFSHTTCPLCRSEVKSSVETLPETSPTTESSYDTNNENSADNSLQFLGMSENGMDPFQSHAPGKTPSTSQPSLDLELGENCRGPHDQIRETGARQPAEDGRSEAHPPDITGVNYSSKRADDGRNNHA